AAAAAITLRAPSRVSVFFSETLLRVAAGASVTVNAQARNRRVVFMTSPFRLFVLFIQSPEAARARRVSPLLCSILVASPVQPVWGLAPTPRPLSPWKYL